MVNKIRVMILLSYKQHGERNWAWMNRNIIFKLTNMGPGAPNLRDTAELLVANQGPV